MNKEAKKFIKKSGLFIKDVEFIDEPILSVEHYKKLYEPSKGSSSGDGFCIFYSPSSMKKGTIHIFPEDVEKKVFDINNLS